MSVNAHMHGFTLIELMIALSLFAFLIVIAGPQYGEFMGNMQIRNGGENTLTGVRLAQAEAIRGNTLAQFVLNPAVGWQVFRCDDEAGAFQLVQSYNFVDGASKTTVTAQPSNATIVTFDGLGRMLTPTNATANPTTCPLDGSATITQIDITNTNVSTPRNLRVVVNPATSSGIKLCDPNSAVATDDPRYCPS